MGSHVSSAEKNLIVLDLAWLYSLTCFQNITMRTHNIYHCPFYPISNIGLDFAIQYWKGKFLFIFNIFVGRKLEERK